MTSVIYSKNRHEIANKLSINVPDTENLTLITKYTMEKIHVESD